MAAKSTEKLKLKYPDEDVDPTITELTLRRPKVKDHIDANRVSDNDAENEAVLFATLTETSVETIKNMDMADYLALQEVYQKMVVGKT